MSTSRTIAKAAAAGSAAVIGAAAAGAGVLGTQALQAKREAGPRRTVPPYADGRYGGNRGVSLRLAMIGDSLAAGLGATYAHETPGAMLAQRLAERAGRPVVLSTIAVVGARSDHLALQVERALITRPTVAVILIGANDITHFRPLRRSAARLRSAILTLREDGVCVVVGTCPDLSASVLIPAPSNRYAHRQSRRLAALQTQASLQVGATTVSLADMLGKEFHSRQLELFAADRFHPNADGYAALAEVLTPAVLSAAGFGLAPLPQRYEPPRTERLNTAIERAVATPGTVLAPPTAVPPGERRRLAMLLLRRRAPEQAGPLEAAPSADAESDAVPL